MKVRIKPLRGAEFYIENVDANGTRVGEIKSRINKLKGAEFPLDALKLIHLGKVLDDDKTLGEYDYKDEHFLVCMIANKKKETPAAAPTAAATTTTPAVQRPTPVTSTAPAATTNPANVATQATTTPASTAVPRAGATLPAGPIISDETVNMLAAMGFDAADARAALQAAYGNPERAVEFLTNPELMEAAMARQDQFGGAGAGTGADNGSNAAGAGGDAAGGLEGALQQFRNSPMFGQVRDQLMANPGQMQAVLEQLQRTNPLLFQAVTQSEETLEQFVEMLMEDPGEGGAVGTNPFGAGAAAGGGAGMGGMGFPGMGAGGMPSPQMMQTALQQLRNLPPEQRNALMQQYGINPQMLDAILNMDPNGLQQLSQAAGGMGMGQQQVPPNAIRLTPAEAEAVTRLTELGFSRRACLEAYLACDKDEQVAANYLFNNPPEEDDLNEQAPPPPNNSNVGGGNDAGDI